MENSRFKFRAWDKEAKKMEYRDWYDLARYGWVQHEYWDYFVFMQYTGLKDKNGKEIYEGDIIEDSTLYIKELRERAKQDHHLSEITDNGGALLYLVEWSNGEGGVPFPQMILRKKTWIKNASERWTPVGVAHKQKGNCWAEVIGNIYENPELLGG